MSESTITYNQISLFQSLPLYQDFLLFLSPLHRISFTRTFPGVTLIFVKYEPHSLPDFVLVAAMNEGSKRTPSRSSRYVSNVFHFIYLSVKICTVYFKCTRSLRSLYYNLYLKYTLSVSNNYDCSRTHYFRLMYLYSYIETEYSLK